MKNFEHAATFALFAINPNRWILEDGDMDRYVRADILTTENSATMLTEKGRKFLKLVKAIASEPEGRCWSDQALQDLTGMGYEDVMDAVQAAMDLDILCCGGGVVFFVGEPEWFKRFKNRAGVEPTYVYGVVVTPESNGNFYAHPSFAGVGPRLVNEADLYGADLYGVCSGKAVFLKFDEDETNLKVTGPLFDDDITIRLPKGYGWRLVVDAYFKAISSFH